MKWTFALAGLLAVAGCPNTPPEPTKAAPPVSDAAPDVSPSASAPAAPSGSARAVERDGGGSTLPDGGIYVEPIGWDLDPIDPARDYVRRYVTATKRYADLLECVQVGKSVRDAATKKSKVEVRESPAAKCKTGTAVRDVFLVDVAGDRLTVDDPKARAPLAAWPDESKPNEKAAPVYSINSILEWKSPMTKVFELQRLSPIRIQGFGRGTYLVITLSGWRAPIARDAGDAKIKEALKPLCEANEGQSFAIGSAMEPVTWLRANCAAGTYKWDKSPVYVPPP